MKPKLILLIAALFSALFVPVFADTFTAAQGTNFSFTVTADGTQPFTYQWSKDGVAIAGATLKDLVLDNVQPVNAGTYSCVVKNSAGQDVAPGAVFTLLVVKPSNSKITGGPVS